MCRLGVDHVSTPTCGRGSTQGSGKQDKDNSSYQQPPTTANISTASTSKVREISGFRTGYPTSAEVRTEMEIGKMKSKFVRRITPVDPLQTILGATRIYAEADSGLLSQYYIPGFATTIFAMMEHFVSDFGFAGDEDSAFREKIFKAVSFLQSSMVAAPGYLLSPHEAPGCSTASADPMVYGVGAHCRRSQMQCRHIGAYIEAPLGAPDSLRNQNSDSKSYMLGSESVAVHRKCELHYINCIAIFRMPPPPNGRGKLPILLGNNTILVRKKADRRAVLLKELDSTFPTFASTSPTFDTPSRADRKLLSLLDPKVKE
ncbi:hypothetical protein K438DRAFT_1776204 [Mycena galopus ATCC 62051]|nr:hypothetical protein K438DRAFT_1776204 [Mycena galopus ATCC 62051]